MKRIDNREFVVTCGKFDGGTVCYGELVETGVDEEDKETDRPTSITLDGVEYDLVPREPKQDN